MDAIKSNFEATFSSKKILNKQILVNLIDSNEWPSIFRLFFTSLNGKLLDLAKNQQITGSNEGFLNFRQSSFILHDEFLNRFSSSPSPTIKQLIQTLKVLQQPPTMNQSEL